MRLANCMKHIEKNPDKKWSVQFSYHIDNINEPSSVRVVSLGAEALYEDWYGDCDCCPSNDTIVSGIKFCGENDTDGEVLVVDEDFVAFETLMDYIEDVLRPTKNIGRNLTHAQ